MGWRCLTKSEFLNLARIYELEGQEVSIKVLMQNLTCQDQAQLDISTLFCNALKSE